MAWCLTPEDVHMIFGTVCEPCISRHGLIDLQVFWSWKPPCRTTSHNQGEHTVCVLLVSGELGSYGDRVSE